MTIGRADLVKTACQVLRAFRRPTRKQAPTGIVNGAPAPKYAKIRYSRLTGNIRITIIARSPECNSELYPLVHNVEMLGGTGR
jgi:hypothetical protein